MSAVETYVRTDEHGVMRVGATRVILDPVVAAFHRGDSPESIVQQDPALSLEEAAYGSITDDLAHRDEADDDLRRQEAERARSAANPGAMIERLIKRTRNQSEWNESHPGSSGRRRIPPRPPTASRPRSEVPPTIWS